MDLRRTEEMDFRLGRHYHKKIGDRPNACSALKRPLSVRKMMGNISSTQVKPIQGG
jgi:hypothetical protein